VIGGATTLPVHVYYPVAGVILLLAAIQLVRSARTTAMEKEPPRAAFSARPRDRCRDRLCLRDDGHGGGVFLAPIILIMNWVEVRRAAAVSAAYNLLNSVAALAGAYATLNRLPAPLPWWLVAAGVGGVVGTTVGSRYLPDHALRYLLAVVLVVSSLKLILS
jgi:hypothetical protein